MLAEVMPEDCPSGDIPFMVDDVSFITGMRRPVPIFLGGTIDNGSAADWQSEFVESLRTSVPEDVNVLLFNPRRKSWDPSWSDLSWEEGPLHEQVLWELHAQRRSEMKAYVFKAGSKSPVTMLELGAFGDPEDTVVVVEPGFYREANVRIFCRFKGISTLSSGKP